MPAHRMPAAQLVPAGEVEPMPAKLAPMLAESGDAPFNRADWMWEPKLDGYRVLAFIDERRREAALAARARARRRLSRSSPRSSASRPCDGMILDGEIVAFDASGKPSFDALQDRAQLKTEREIAAADQNTPVVFYCFDLLHFAGIDLRKAPYRGSPPLSRAMPAALAAGAARACGGGRRRAARGGARERLRRRGRQAQGQPLRGRPALGVVAEGEADAERGLRRRRLHARARARARRSARCWSATGTKRQAALRLARRLGLRRRARSRR